LLVLKIVESNTHLTNRNYGKGVFESKIRDPKRDLKVKTLVLKIRNQIVVLHIKYLSIYITIGWCVCVSPWQR